jgi:hypothetical protein
MGRYITEACAITLLIVEDTNYFFLIRRTDTLHYAVA